MSNFKIPKVRDVKHRRFIASLPCLLSGRTDVQAAHIRAKGNAGVGLKPSDSRTVPLSCETHRVQHEIGERVFWEGLGGIDKAIELAEALYSVTGDRDKAIGLMAKWTST